MHIERTDYDDGGWCDQQYANGKLHGLWTVYAPSGKKKWEREYRGGRQEGYEREWDELGNLRDEKWFHLGVLHGVWREWDANGMEVIVGDFFFGKAKRADEVLPKLHSNWGRIYPYWFWGPDEFRAHFDAIERELVLPTRRLTREASRRFQDNFGASYFNYVNVLAFNEEWPTSEDVPLLPLMQLDCRSIAPLPHSLEGIVYLTMFAKPEPTEACDLLVRSYRNIESLRHVKPPSKTIAEQPTFVKVGDIELSYPDANDLPPGLRVFLADDQPQSRMLKEDEHRFASRFGGWPAWLQWSKVESYGELVLQIDRLDVPMLRGGDGAVHYFFHNESNWTWISECLSPLFHSCGRH